MVHDETATINTMIQWATHELAGGSIINPLGEAEWIIEDITGLKKAELYLKRDYALIDAEVDLIEHAVHERLSGQPLQYILGHQQFRYLDLKCRGGVLIPRPETELLVDEALKELERLGGAHTILDIGAGTGAIGLSIAHEYEGAKVYSVDISDDALELTRENAEAYGLLDRVTIIKSNLFDALDDLKGTLDMVVANPPYIPSRDMPRLQPEVQFEPALALDGGEDGLNFYRAIVLRAQDFIVPGGVLLFEIGFNQAEDVARLIEDTGQYTGVAVYKDYQGYDRIVRAQRK